MSVRDAIKKSVYSVGETKADAIEFAREMKKNHPHKQDYGYGAEGITLNSWNEMRDLFLTIGPVSVAEKSHKMISQTYRKTVGMVVDEMLAFAAVDNSYLGRFCWSGRVERFIQTTQMEWLDEMVLNYTLPFALDVSQKEAWRACYVPLKRALKEQRYSFQRDTLAVFEYVLPDTISAGQVTSLTYPDLLLVRGGRITVVEFKSFSLAEEAADKYMKQARKYKRRLLEYHAGSQGAQIRCVLVSIGMNGIYQIYDSDIFCSGDRLSQAIRRTFAGEPIGNAVEPQEWLDSNFNGLE